MLKSWVMTGLVLCLSGGALAQTAPNRDTPDMMRAAFEERLRDILHEEQPVRDVVWTDTALSIEGSVTDLLSTVCNWYRGDDDRAACAGFAAGSKVEDRLRLARAVAHLQGWWTLPPVENRAADALMAQVNADVRLLSTHLAERQAKRMEGIALEGDAIALVPERITFEELRHGAEAAPLGNRDLAGLVGDPMACDTPGLPDELRALSPELIALPKGLHGEEPLLAVVTIAEGVNLPGLVFRKGEEEAELLLPAHPAGPEGGNAVITLMYEGGFTQIRRQCAPQLVRLAPPPVREGAYPDRVRDDIALAQGTNALAQMMGGPLPLDEGWIAQHIDEAEEMLKAYEHAGPDMRWLLDMAATVPETTGMSSGGQVAKIKGLMAQIERNGTPRATTPARQPLMLPILSDLIWKSSFSNAFPTDFSVYDNACPADMDELEEFMRMGHAGSFAQTMEAKVYYTGASMLGGLSLKLGIMGVGGNKKVADGVDKAFNFATALYAIHLGYLDGMMPNSLPKITADVEGKTIYEDQLHGLVLVKNIKLHTKSKGWDRTKALLDLGVAIAGLTGKTGTGKAADKVGTTLGGKLAKELGEEGAEIAQSSVNALIGSSFGFVEGEILGALYGGLSKQLKTTSKSTKVQKCEVPMYDENDASIRLEDPDLVYQNEFFGAYRPVRAGRAELIIEPNTTKRRYPIPNFSYDTMPRFREFIEVPRIEISREESDFIIQAGDPARFSASLLSASNPDTRLRWELPGETFLTHVVAPDTLSVSTTTSRKIENYPALVKTYLEGRFLPQSDAPDRFINFALQAGGLWLVPTRRCIEPGMEAEIIAFDSRTKERIPARDLVFHTVEAGSSIDGKGIVTTQRRMDEVTVIARGVGANAYRGRVKLRGTCTCGTEFFDPKLVTDTAQNGWVPMSGQLTKEGGAITSLTGQTIRKLPSLTGMELFGLKGEIEGSISGAVAGSFRQDLPLDIISHSGKGARGPSCHTQMAGLSPFYFGTFMELNRPGMLIPAPAEDAIPNSFDLDRMAIDLEALGGPEGYMMATPVGTPRVILEEFGRKGVVLRVSGPFETERIEGWDGKVSVMINVTFRSRLD